MENTAENSKKKNFFPLKKRYFQDDEQKFLCDVVLIT